MARYINRDKIEYELILAANGHFVVAARKELIDGLPVEDVEPAKSITAADIKKTGGRRKKKVEHRSACLFLAGAWLGSSCLVSGRDTPQYP